MLRLHADYENFNPFRVPNWRWERVLKLCDRYPTPGRVTLRDDEFVRKGRNFLLRWRARDEEGRRELFWEEPGLFYAYEVHEKSMEEPEPATFIQARLLAGQPIAEIAKSVSTRPETIAWYEALYFNVSDRLENRDWITKQVLVPALIAQVNTPKPTSTDEDVEEDATKAIRDFIQQDEIAKPYMDGSLKLVSYFGGPLMADLMISGMQAGKPLKAADDIAIWIDQGWAQVIRRRSMQAALQFKINKFNVMDLFAIHTRIMEIERSPENENKTRTSQENHIKAMVDEIPWLAGPDNKKALTFQRLAEYDSQAAELRDNEVMQVAAGEEPAGLQDAVFPLRMPSGKTATTTAPPEPKKPGKS